MTREKEIDKMLDALRKMHPDCGLIQIDTNYRSYDNINGVEVEFHFYVEYVKSRNCKSWQELKALVAQHLEDK